MRSKSELGHALPGGRLLNFSEPVAPTGEQAVCRRVPCTLPGVVAMQGIESLCPQTQPPGFSPS